MKIEPTDKCANPNCHCTALMETNYCSEYCEFHSGDIVTGCQCGHPVCQSLRVRALSEIASSNQCQAEE